MFDLLFADGSQLWRLDVWYALPAIIAVSLVYSATRHEKMQPLLIHAGRTAVWIAGFMIAVFVALQAINWQIGP
jgi:hypothetical protein